MLINQIIILIIFYSWANHHCLLRSSRLSMIPNPKSSQVERVELTLRQITSLQFIRRQVLKRVKKKIPSLTMIKILQMTKIQWPNLKSAKLGPLMLMGLLRLLSSKRKRRSLKYWSNSLLGSFSMSSTLNMISSKTLESEISIGNCLSKIHGLLKLSGTSNGLMWLLPLNDGKKWSRFRRSITFLACTRSRGRTTWLGISTKCKSSSLRITNSSRKHGFYLINWRTLKIIHMLILLPHS